MSLKHIKRDLIEYKSSKNASKNKQYYDMNNNSINGDLICGVCHAEFRNPKILPCLHTFCKTCLEDTCVELFNEESYVKCPLCSTRKKINASASACLEELLSDFVALNELDTCAINANEINGDVTCSVCSMRAQSRCSECAVFLCVNCQRAHKKQASNHKVCSLALLGLDMRSGDYCRVHAGQKLTHYCETCKSAVCNDCTLLDHPNDDHEVKVLSEVTPNHRRQLAELLTSVRQKTPFLKRTLLDIDSVLQALPDSADAVAREIARTTENLIRLMRTRQETLLDELAKLCAYKVTVLHDQKSRIKSELEILESNCDTTEKILRNGSNSEIANVNSIVSKRLEFLKNMMLDINAEENAEFGYDSGFEKSARDILNTGSLYLVRSSPVLKMLGDGLHDAAVGKFASFTLAQSKKNEITPAELDIRIETPDAVLLECDVTQSGQMRNVVYNPKVPGEHEISVTIRGEHLPDSPVCVNVKQGHMAFAQKPTRCLTLGGKVYYSSGISTLGCFDQPCDVTVGNNGHILVADTSNHRVQTFTSSDKLVSVFGSKGSNLGQLLYPSGITILPHCDVIVSDHGNHRVQVFTSDGVYLRSFGDHGSDEGYLDHPTGIAVDEEGHIVVVDQGNNRVQVFDENGVYLRHFGCYGSQDGHLDCPMYVAVTPDGDIVVTDSRNHRVQVFDSDGRHRKTFGSRGSADGEFQYPTGITIDAAGYIVVSDQTCRVQVFDPDLKFVTKFEPSSVDQLDCPMGIDYTPEGKIVLADKANNNVKIFYI